MTNKFPMLVDGKNCAYRALYANRGGGFHNYHHFVVMLRFISSWILHHRPSSVHIFWDANRKNIWRRQILETYKSRSDVDIKGIKDELADLIYVARALFGKLNVRQYKRKGMEADDLIYAACKVLCPKDTIIVSSDGDFKQIPFFMPHVRLYDPRQNEFVERPDINPVIQKALMGEKTDSIPGYESIGPVRSKKLTESLKLRNEWLEAAGSNIFARNMLLVDLGLCPDLVLNELYVSSAMATEVSYDKHEIHKLAQQYKVVGLVSEYDRIVTPFKSLK